jgi:hypothetical protein
VTLRQVFNPLTGQLDLIDVGAGAVPIVYHQSILASTWVVTHVLGHRPQVEVADEFGFDLWPTIDVDPNPPYDVSIVHTAQLTGWVYLQ